MKKKLVVLLLCVLLHFTTKGQGRIEILVNGKSQQLTNESKRVFNEEDKIEIRIYPNNYQQISNVVDSLSTEGCGIKLHEKERNKIIIFRPKTQQQQQQSSTKATQEKYIVTRTIKPLIRDRYISFAFSVKDVTACKGKSFQLMLQYNPKKSMLNKFAGYRSSYKFYFVL